MPRSFEPNALVTLPNLTAHAALALLSAILTAAKQTKKPPAQIAEVIRRVTDAKSRLEKALSERLTPADETGQRVADTDEDNAWSALLDWLTGLSRLPPRFAEAGQAAQVIAVLFPDGLKFTRVPYREEWSEVETRLSRMRADGLDDLITTLGGKPFLDNIHAAHKAYGAALGITSPTEVTTPAEQSVGAALDEARAALRSYALRVASWGDEGHREPAELLLTPLTTWESRPASKGEPETDTKSPTPTPAPAPTDKAISDHAESTSQPEKKVA